MGVTDHLEQREAEEDGDIVRELVAVRYVGEHSTFAPSGNFQNQSYCPSNALMNQGVWHLWIIPDAGLDYIEQRDDFEIAYTKEGIAEAILQKTHLPDNVFGRGADAHLQRRVFDKLGLKNVGLGEDANNDYVEQLAEIAGVELEEESEMDIKRNKKIQSYIDDYSRRELVNMAEERGKEDARGMKKLDLAEWIADNELEDSTENDTESGELF